MNWTCEKMFKIGKTIWRKFELVAIGKNLEKTDRTTE